MHVTTMNGSIHTTYINLFSSLVVYLTNERIYEVPKLCGE
jgi:hypothetical protein